MKQGDFHFLIVAFILIWVTANINLNKNWNKIIEYDIAGYYAYLPAIFIYQDLSFGFYEQVNQKYSPDKFRGDYRQKLENEKIVNKYYVGTAVLQVPFFVLGHLLTKMTGHSPDGYSYWYMVALAMSSVFYTLLGLYYFAKILDKYSINCTNKWLVLYAVTFGTNIFVYAAIDSGMSHPYSFACISALIWNFIGFQKQGEAKYLYGMAFLLGLIVLLRPINILVVLGLPIFVNSWKEIYPTFQRIIQKPSRFFGAVLLFLAIVCFQLLIYKIQTGRWIVYSYAEESFNFLKPEIFNFLFSYRKGYFLYTPLALLSFLSLIFWYKKNPYKSISIFLFLSFMVYVFSSWWSWWYGGSFSSRVMLEYSVFVFLPLAILLEKAKPNCRKILIGIIILLVIFCQIQIYQFRYYQIHYAEMTKELYWENFLRIDKIINKK